MGLLDDLKGAVMGATAPAPAPQTSGLAQVVLGMLMNREGGLSGLVSAFQQKGLGDLVSSWISTGKNLPISPQQLQEVVGQDQLQQFAASAGISPEAAGTHLADILPRVVDQLTPDGTLPPGPLTTKALDALKNVF